MKTFVQKKSDPTSDRLQLLTVVGCDAVACVPGADWKETIVKFDDGSQIGYCRLCGGDSYFSDDDLLPERLVGTRGPGTFVALHKREHFDRHYHVVAVHCDAPPLGQTMTRNQKILALRGKKSMGLIAQELGVTRAVVAGVFFRHDNDPVDLVYSPAGTSRNTKGYGKRGGAHAYASETMRDPRGR